MLDVRVSRSHNASKHKTVAALVLILRVRCFAVQKLDLYKANKEDSDSVRGQIVISLISRDRGNEALVPDVNEIPREPNELPDG